MTKSCARKQVQNRFFDINSFAFTPESSSVLKKSNCSGNKQNRKHLYTELVVALWDFANKNNSKIIKNFIVLLLFNFSLCL